jgi:hypothetical protein
MIEYPVMIVYHALSLDVVRKKEINKGGFPRGDGQKWI